MPTYRFKNNDTQEEWVEFMGISEAELYLTANPNVERLLNGAPLLASGMVMGVNKTKPEDGFRDVLREIKKNNSKGLSSSTVNTF